MNMKKAIRIYHISNIVCIVTGLIGLFLVFFSPSGIDNNAMTWAEFLILEAIGFVNLFISYGAFKINENYKNYINNKRRSRR